MSVKDFKIGGIELKHRIHDDEEMMYLQKKTGRCVICGEQTHAHCPLCQKRMEEFYDDIGTLTVCEGRCHRQLILIGAYLNRFKITTHWKQKKT